MKYYSSKPTRKVRAVALGNNSKAGNSIEDADFLMKNLLGYDDVFQVSNSSSKKTDPLSVLDKLESNLRKGYDIIIVLDVNMLDSRLNGFHAVTYLVN